eukprot:scaffold327_cov257-Pinguiococcus_pyrenoidosus.AAC.46
MPSARCPEPLETGEQPRSSVCSTCSLPLRARVKIIREKGRPTCKLVDALDVFVDSRGTSRKWRAAVIFLEYDNLICIRWLGYTETWVSSLRASLELGPHSTAHPSPC